MHAQLLRCVYSDMSDSLQPPWTVACQTLLSIEFSKQEYRSGLPFPTPYCFFGIHVNNKMNPSKLTTISRTKILPIIKHFKHFPICCPPLKSNKYFNFVLKIKHFYLYIFSLTLNFTELNILYADFLELLLFFSSNPTIFHFGCWI